MLLVSEARVSLVPGGYLLGSGASLRAELDSGRLVGGEARGGERGGAAGAKAPRRQGLGLAADLTADGVLDRVADVARLDRVAVALLAQLRDLLLLLLLLTELALGEELAAVGDDDEAAGVAVLGAAALDAALLLGASLIGAGASLLAIIVQVAVVGGLTRVGLLEAGPAVTIYIG